MADNEGKLDWMYKGASGLVDREDYLLGRTVDKTLEQLNNEEKEKKLGIVPPKNHVEHECIPPSIRDFNKIVAAEQVDLSAKLQEDPLVAIRKREEEARRQFLQNPVQLKKLQEALKAQQEEKKNKMKKKRKHDSSDSDLDQKLMDKFKYLKHNSSVLQKMKKQKKKSKENVLDTILMHKFNELKDKLTEEDMKDILEGRLSDSSSDNEKHRKKNRKRKNSSSSEEEPKQKDISRSKSRKNSRDLGDEIGKRSEKGTLHTGKGNKIGEGNANRRNYSKDEYTSRKSNNNRDRYRKKQESGSSDSESDSDTESYTRRNKQRNDKMHKKKKEKYKKYSSSDQSSEEESSDGKNRKSSGKKRQDYLDKDRKYTNNTTAKRKEVKVKYNNSDSNDGNESKIKGREKNKKRIKKKYGDDSDSSEDEHRERNSTKRKRNHSRGDEDSKNDCNDLDNLILEKLRSLRDSSYKEKTNETANSNIQKEYAHYDSDEDKSVYKEKKFGLLKADGTKIHLKKDKPETSTIIAAPVIKTDNSRKTDKKQIKRLTESEKEQLRQQMMKDAEVREHERSENLRKYREENKEEVIKDFDKNFAHKELLKSTKNTSVEDRIKSKINNIQRSSSHMNSNFSKRN